MNVRGRSLVGRSLDHDNLRCRRRRMLNCGRRGGKCPGRQFVRRDQFGIASNANNFLVPDVGRFKSSNLSTAVAALLDSHRHNPCSHNDLFDGLHVLLGKFSRFSSDRFHRDAF